MDIYTYNKADKDSGQIRSVHSYVLSSLPFTERRDRDLDTITDKMSIWSDQVTANTGVSYSTREEIERYSDYRHQYQASSSAVIFPIEALGGEEKLNRNSYLQFDSDPAIFVYPYAVQFGQADSKMPSYFGFFGSIYQGEGDDRSQRYRYFETGLAIPQEVMDWMTEQQLSALAETVTEASHDYAHSHEVFMPDGHVPELMEEWMRCMLLSDRAKPEYSLENYELKAVYENNIVFKKMYEEDPSLKQKLIAKYSDFIGDVEAYCSALCAKEPLEADRHRRIAAYVCSLYLSQISPGIQLDDVPGAKPYIDPNRTYAKIKEDLEYAPIPWGKHGLATPEEISVLHSKALRETMANDAIQPSFYRGKASFSAWEMDICITVEQAKELSEAYADILDDSFLKKLREEAQALNVHSADALPSVQSFMNLVEGIHLHATPRAAPTGITKRSVNKGEDVVNELLERLARVPALLKQFSQLPDRLSGLAQEFSSKRMMYQTLNSERIREVTQKLIDRQSAVNENEDTQKLAIEASILARAENEQGVVYD